ncbi:MAG: ABC transporter ATP-binding protein [Flexilinea sp.]
MTPALNGVNLSIMRGEYVGIIGKSGAGKTTLINMLAGLDNPTEGDIEIDGIHVQQLNEVRKAQWRGNKVGVIFQSFQLLPGLNLVDNVMLPMDFVGTMSSHKKESREKASALLEMVGLEEHLMKKPSEISGGQQQRVAIARALINDPEILLADEPTGRLDSVTSETVFDIFDHVVQKGTTIIIVSHDKSLGERTKRLIRIADNKIAEDSNGSHSS